MAKKVEKEISERIKDAIRVASIEITGEQTVSKTKLIHFKTPEKMRGTAFSHDEGKTYKVFYDGFITDLMDDVVENGKPIGKPTVDAATQETTIEQSTSIDTPDDENNNIVLEDDNGRILVPTKQPISSYNKGTLKMILRGVISNHPNHKIVNKNIPDDLRIKENLIPITKPVEQAPQA